MLWNTFKRISAYPPTANGLALRVCTLKLFEAGGEASSVRGRDIPESREKEREKRQGACASVAVSLSPALRTSASKIGHVLPCLRAQVN